MNFVYIKPNELRDNWKFVREGLEKVISKGHSTWLPEDIYCDCFEQRSMLWLCENGFMVLQPNGTEMHIWAAWLDSNNPDDLAKGLEVAKNIARQGNCTKITFSSVRKGWEVKARELGYRPRVWELDI